MASRSRRSSAAPPRRSVRVHGGEVESLTQATTAGIGVRVVQDGRQGFAYAGTLDPAVIAEVLAEARDNAAFAEPEDWVGLAEPDGVEPPAIDLWRDGLAEMPTDRKLELALDLERAVRARDPRIVGVRVAQWGDGSGVGAVVTSTGIAVAGRSTGCHLSVQALAEDGGETKTGYGVSVGRRAGRHRPGGRRRRGGRPHHSAAGRRAARQRHRDPGARAADGRHAAGRRGRDARRRVGAEGPVALRRPGGRADRVAPADARGRPHRSPLPRGGHPRRRGPRHPARPPDRGRRAAGLPPQLDDRPPCRGAVDGLGRARLPVDARRRRPGPGHGARRRARSTIWWPGSTTACSCRP